MANLCTFIGNIGKDPELKTSQSGTPFCTFSIAVNKGSGEKKETTWINMVAFNKTAEYIGNNLKKGSMVYVEGELKIEEYTKDNVKHVAPKIIVNRVENLSRSGEGASKVSEQTATAVASTGAAGGISPDDIPF